MLHAHTFHTAPARVTFSYLHVYTMYQFTHGLTHSFILTVLGQGPGGLAVGVTVLITETVCPPERECPLPTKRPLLGGKLVPGSHSRTLMQVLSPTLASIAIQTLSCFFAKFSRSPESAMRVSSCRR